jgi:hypothetical protein
MKNLLRALIVTTALGSAASLMPVSAVGQVVSTNGGSIEGTITDPSGAAIPNASITITSPDTGYSRTLSSDKAGFYSVGPLNPGNYTVTVTAPSFEHQVLKTVIRTGTATTGSVKLVLGNQNETIEVDAGALQINTDQAGVSDVITKEQIQALPVNGRNFLDLAQIEPGVVLQSGESFDPTKAGYSAISVSGVSGRTTRILLDGQDITDETVGTTIFNVSQGAINEFQLNRSTQDVSGDVTSTGQVLVSTNSGTNAFHGQLFYNLQDARAGFAATKDAVTPPFQRNQFGGSAGGYIIKDKLFFFGNSERIKQDSLSASPVGTTFASILSKYPVIPSPYRETYSTARLDYNGPRGGHYFVRVNYNVMATGFTRTGTILRASLAVWTSPPAVSRTHSAAATRSSTTSSPTPRPATAPCMTVFPDMRSTTRRSTSIPARTTLLRRGRSSRISRSAMTAAGPTVPTTSSTATA